jgi:hypothetical protein
VTDERVDAPPGDPPYAYSPTICCDHGLTWAASDLRLDSSTDSVDNDFGVCCDGAHVYVAWSDGRLGDAAIFANGSIP